MAPDLVQDDFSRGIALKVDHNTHAQAARFISDVRNAFDPLFFGSFSDLLDEIVFADLIGDRGQNNALTVAALGLDLVTAAHQNRTTPGGIGCLGAGLAEN